MSDALNALIAFAGFLMLFSVLVTSFQSGLKNLLSLKTRVWERFFLGIYRHDFRLDTGAAERETTHRGRRSLPFVGEFQNRLKRLRDMLIEAEEPFGQFQKAIEDIADVDPDSPDAARVVTEHLSVLEDALYSVKGLRMDSLLPTYDRVSGMGIGKFYEAIPPLEGQLTALRGDVDAATIRALISGCRQLANSVRNCRRTLSEYKIQIERKADAWLSQLNQEYKKNMLKWTVIIGAALVLAFNADAFNIFRFLLNDTETRKAISAIASETAVSAYKARAEDLNSVDKAIDGGKMSEAVPKLTVLLQDIRGDFSALGATREAKKTEALLKRLEASRPPEVAVVQELYGEAISLFAVLQEASIDNQLQRIASLDLPLGWKQEGRRWAAAVGPLDGSLYLLSKIGGLFLTSVLITFGAPFWKDVMNALSGAKKVISRTGSR